MANEVGDRAVEGHAYGSLGNAYQSLVHYSKAIEYRGQDLTIAKKAGDRAGELAKALLLMLTTLLDRIVTRQYRRVWMIECVRRQSGSRLPWMVTINFQNCTWCT